MANSQKRIAKELQDLTTSPPSGISVALVDESDIYIWKATIEGPKDSPYAGGTFHLLVTLPQTYPFKPPTLSFLTKVYHPNVSNDVPANAVQFLSNKQALAQVTTPASSNTTSLATPASTPATTAPATTGLMCLGPLRPDAWKPSTKISAILEFARQLLREPNPDDAVETRIADEYKNNRAEFDKEAREYTKRYASGRK